MQIMEATRDSNTPEFEYPYFFDQEIENSSEIQGLCLQIFSRDLALEQLKRQGFLVVDTTESFRDRLRAVGYT